MKSKGTVIISTNSAWTLYNFRLSLMQALLKQGFDVVAAAPLDQHAEAFRSNGIRFVRIRMSIGGINPFKEAVAVLDYFRLYRRERPVLTHHFSIKPMIFGTLAARLAGVKTIVNTVTGLGYAFHGHNGLALYFLKFVAKYLFRRPAHILFQNSADLEYFLASKFISADQAGLVLGSGIDIERFMPKEDNGFLKKGRPIRFLMYGRMLWQKGVPEYLEAAERVNRIYGKERAEFWLIGGANSENSTGVESEWIANPWTIPGKWLENKTEREYINWFPHDNNILPYIESSDVIVLPTYYPEGLPRSLLESMACGKPVITTDIPGCTDLVLHEVNGLLVQPKNVEDLSQAMIKLIEEPHRIKKMGKAARERISNRFSDNIVINGVFEEYRKVGIKI